MHPEAESVRRPAVAGAFYPAAASALATLVDDLFKAARALPGVGAPRPMPVGVLVPHAGLIYSGVTAAAAWTQLAGVDARITIVVLGTNHSAGWLHGVGACGTGAWQTPTGDVSVDQGLAASIVDLGPPFVVDREAHLLEHSIEVQLPLLLKVAPGARIVPLAVSAGRGPAALAAGRRLGALLKRERSAGHAVVLAISSDMAHYPSDLDCERVTEALTPALEAVDAAALAASEGKVCTRGIRGLVCGMCGIDPAVVGLAALRQMGARVGTVLAAATSADVGGSRARTVGYLATRFDA